MIKDNNFSKYLLYAIGEILLVIIGILMALQINNWNEQRKLANERTKESLKGKECPDFHLLTNLLYLTVFVSNKPFYAAVLEFFPSVFLGQTLFF